MRRLLLFALLSAVACGTSPSPEADPPAIDGGLDAGDSGAADLGAGDAEPADLGLSPDAEPSDSGVEADAGVAPDPTHFVAAASMNRASSNQTATVLEDGRVLVVGGLDNRARMLGRSEVWDPLTDSWRALGPQALRANHTATRLLDGRVLVVGGGRENSIGAPSGVGVLATALLFDPRDDSWTETASLSVGRSHHTATLLPDGRVWVVGGSAGTALVQPGFGDALGSSELWDPTTERWSPGPSLQVPRYLHSADRLSTGELAIAGGADPSEAELPQVELLSLEQATSRLGPVMSSGRVFQVAALLPSGAWLLATGKQANIRFLNSVELLASDGASLSGAPPIPGESRTAATLSRLPSGRLLLAGGLHGSPAGFYQLADAMIYEEESATWTLIGSLNTARVLHSAAVLQDGTVLLCGGLDASGVVASCERAVP